MAFLIHLLLAHFLADYPLQSGRLVALKMKRFLGIFIHGLVHLVVLLLILSPLLHGGRTWGAIVIIYITHNLIDHFKVKFDGSDPRHHRFFYFFDQVLHWSILVGSAYYLGDVAPNLSGQFLEWYTHPTLFLYLLLMIVSTYFFDVSRYFLTQNVNKVVYKRDYKFMFINGGVVTVAFALLWLM